MSETLRSYLNFAVETAYLAGKITLGYFQTGIHADTKADGSPVTTADRKVEEFIRGRIEKAYPDHAIAGEEYGESGGKGVSHRWIIDPIDGTKSFVQGVPLYAVLIGLEIDGRSEVGVVYFPGLDEMLSGAIGEGSWWNGRRVHVSSSGKPLSESVVCFTEPATFWKCGHESVFQNIMRTTKLFMGWNDAYGYFLVATGRAHAMVDPAINPWDCAPYPPIFHEAGGVYCNWAGVETIYGQDGLATNPELLPELLALINK